MNLDELTYKVRGAIYEVFKQLGPGLFESVYEAALKFELTNAQLKVESQFAVPVLYKSVRLDIGFRVDLLVEDEIIIKIH